MKDWKKSLDPYVRLTRLDRPTGIWLLLLPCYWAVVLLRMPLGASLKAFILFGLGAVAMRSAGCAWNDWVDRDYDPHVHRTSLRPLSARKLEPWQVFTTIFACCVLALFVWIMLTPFAKSVSLLSLSLAIAYPYAKRFMSCPQLFLGLAFNSGIWIVWAHMHATFWTFWPALFLYGAGICWTMAYDTVYAIPDRDDDRALGLGSCALTVGSSVKKAVSLFYGGSFVAFVLAGLLAGFSTLYYFVLVFGILCILWKLQGLNLEDANECQTFFRRNALLGWVILFGMLIAV